MPPAPRSDRPSGFPWNAQGDPFARTTDPTDPQQLVDRTRWLHERSLRHDGAIGRLEYGTRSLLGRAAATALVVAQVVLLALPWFVLHPEDSLAQTVTAGPWTLVGTFTGFESLDLSYLLVVLLPVVVYVAALAATAIAAFASGTRARVVAIVLDLVAFLVAVAQVGLISGSGEEATSVEVLAPGVTAILLWAALAAAVGVIDA